MTAPASMPPLPEGYILHRFETLDGTNAEALRAGAPPGAVYISRRQTSGRGRQGRDWQSPDGNLYATICAQPPENRNPAQLAFVAALAVLDTVSEAAPSGDFSLKWPNDILAGGRKVSGILIEAGDRGYAIGIGVNIVSSPAPDEVRFPATNLADFAGPTSDPELLVAVLCRHFDAWYRRWAQDGFEPLRAVWLASGHRMGDTIAASTGVDRIEGRFQGLDSDGALVLEDAGGVMHIVTAGDVFFPGAD